MISTPLTVFAPAKINLALHVTGRRADGYHLLDSLVAFADIGDRLHISPGPEVRLRVMGPRAGDVPTGPENLVVRAARLMAGDRGVDLVLEKHLPAAAGIGGGSSDAAAGLRGLAELWEAPLPDTDTLLTLGADLPVCLTTEPKRMQGIGELLTEVPALPPLQIVLANPRVPVSTGEVFGGLEEVEGAPMTPPGWTDLASFITWLCAQRNDLEPPARQIAPVISDAIDALNAQPGCLLARMSGSGATCFGLFATRDAARDAVQSIATGRPNWWVETGAVL